MAKEEKKQVQVPVFKIEMRADHSATLGTIKNRRRLLTLPEDQKEYDHLGTMIEEYWEWERDKDKK